MKIIDLIECQQQLKVDEGAKEIITPALAALLALTPAASQKIEMPNKPAATQQDYKPADSAYYKIGAPYKIKGQQYKPRYNPTYDKDGIASWYGPGFDGKITANGDIFDQDAMTAASPTLPMFSKVWVTNKDNGKKVLLTVNDRGPYHPGRILDVSKAAAKELGFHDSGTANVNVKFDRKETIKYLKKMGYYDQFLKATGQEDQIAKNENIDETAGAGRIVKGVNTTRDVDEYTTKREAEKFGNIVDKDGRPPLITNQKEYLKKVFKKRD